MMSFATKTFIAIAALGAAAALPAPARQVVTPPQALSSAPAPTVQSRAVELAAAIGADSNCFVARKKSARRKAANHVRLVRVCD